MSASSSLSTASVELNINALSLGLSLSMMCAPLLKSLEACSAYVYHRLYGIATLQVFLYYSVYGKNDNRLNKGFVSPVRRFSIDIDDANLHPGTVYLVLQNLDDSSNPAHYNYNISGCSILFTRGSTALVYFNT